MPDVSELLRQWENGFMRHEMRDENYMVSESLLSESSDGWVKDVCVQKEQEPEISGSCGYSGIVRFRTLLS